MAKGEYESFAEQVLGAYRPDERPDDALVVADFFTEHGDLPLTASALDRAYSLNPNDESVALRRSEVLEQLEVIEFGLRFRYIPAGSFLMGSDQGDHDEKPVHPVRLQGFWMAEIPTTWATFSDLLDWSKPPMSQPKNQGRSRYGGMVGLDLRMMYSGVTQNPDEAEVRRIEMEYGDLRATVDPKLHLRRPIEFDVHPVVAVAKDDAMEMCGKISNGDTLYRLPSEAEWEKAARGGLAGKRYPWGDEPPQSGQCDFNRLGQSSILPPKRTYQNGYGLYGMSGGVWEWTLDTYDSQAYRSQQEQVPLHEETPGLLGRLATRVTSIFTQPDQREHALRGGSWTDCAEAVTVSFRSSRDSVGWESDVYQRRQHITPTIGFRICRFGDPVQQKQSDASDERTLFDS
ncbi:MAG: formylglycine-generating enzyme family protein [Rubripirellula sp.]